jgi:2-oxoisovalerate dehydrogenase E1 component
MVAQNTQQMLELYKYMVASRESDLVEAELVNSGEANFLASSKGHEGSVILAPFLIPSDYLHCHYRDKSLMLARGISSTMFFYSALAKAESHSHGRQMVSHMSAPELNIMSLVGPVGNNALQAAGVAFAIKNQQDKPIVICSFGDGTSQQGEVIEAIAEAKRSQLPVLFFIHNNSLAISTRTTGKTFFSLPGGRNAQSFYDTPITYIDGTRPLEQYATIESIISGMRKTREPQIIVFNVDRLDNHSNADDQKLYRDTDEITLSKEYDPLSLSYDYLLKIGISKTTLDDASEMAILEVRNAVDIARNGNNPQATFTAEKPLPKELSSNAPEYRGDFEATERITMLEAMKQAFDFQLTQNQEVYLFGQDIEDDKGDVFGITRGLSTKYPGRVRNSPLSESTIVGMACGMALTGKRPVAFVQFADFMPLAYNQIFSELATMYWRTNGGWQCPVIVFAACGGYRPGLGPFHSQTNEATYAHIPGLDVYMPSNAADAAGMLNAAFKSERPCVFFYPKKLLNNSSIHDTTSPDIDKHLVPVGKARIIKPGTDITLVGWGNTISLCSQVADTLETVGVDAEIIDLRTIKPYDLETILASVEKTQKLIVTHEDNITCGVGGDIIAAVAERSKKPLQVRRVARSDTYTPCNYANQLAVLPSFEKILTAAAELLNLDLKFEEEDTTEIGVYNVEVIGASPSDESVLINTIHVKLGTAVKPGDILVDIEASKSAGEILSPCTGIIEEIFVVEAERAIVGEPLLKIRLAEGAKHLTGQIKPKKVILNKKSVTNNNTVTISGGIFPVGMGMPYFKTGSRRVFNDEILKNFPDKNSSDIEQRTGIKQRYWLAQDENIVDIATNVVNEALANNNLKLSDINTIICSTSSPEEYQSPSMACLILSKLYATHGEHAIPAYDINAACSGYLYGLQNAKDYLQTRPDERVLLITAESLSSRIDLHNFETAFLFGDAATVTILYGNNHIEQSIATVDQINLSAIGEDGAVLNLPVNKADGITLQGKKLFTIAVKTMSLSMHKCCSNSGIELTDIDVVVPHQANQRITSAVEHRLKLPKDFIFSNIATYGNTSSCTIPIGLAEVLPNEKNANKIGLCAFGGGFTAGAALLTMR